MSKSAHLVWADSLAFHDPSLSIPADNDPHMCQRPGFLIIMLGKIMGNHCYRVKIHF